LSSTNAKAPIIGNLNSSESTPSPATELLYQEDGSITLNSWKDGVTNVWINAG
jgi:hypothetical protein